jgi:hypothetical protein
VERPYAFKVLNFKTLKFRICSDGLSQNFAEGKQMKITVRKLKSLGACTSQVNLFEEIFGQSVELTEAVVKEHGAKFDTNWLASKVLTSTQYADYEAKLAPLDADYQAKLAPLDADYKAKLAPLDADYKAKLALLYADYDAKRALLYADYKAKRAFAFWEVIK